MQVKSLRNLDDEATYIAVDDERAAHLVVQRILEAVALLVEQPGIGRPGRLPGTRELVVPKTRYIGPYRVRGQTVEVLCVCVPHVAPPAGALVALHAVARGG